VFICGQISRRAIGAPPAARWIRGSEIFLDRVAHGSDDSSISVKAQNPNRKLFLWPMTAIVLGAFAAVNPFYQPAITHWPWAKYQCPSSARIFLGTGNNALSGSFAQRMGVDAQRPGEI